MRLDDLSFRLQERWQREPCSQRFDIYIYGKTRVVGSNLEEDASRLTEVDRTEVEPVNHRSHCWINPGNTLPPLPVFLVIRCAECDMMNAPNANKTMERRLRIDLHVYFRTRSSWPNL